MSLKAKLEAVIYAAEEPVTLTQLAALFAADAMEWKAEQEAASAAAAAEQEAESLPLLNAAFDYLELEPAAEALAAETETGPTVAGEEPAAAAEGDAGAETGADAGPSTEDEAAGEAETAVPEADAAEAGAEPPAADPEAEAKRLARVRDREVRGILRGLLDELIADYASDDRGIEVKEIAGGYRMATKPECHDAARMFVKSLKPALKLSLPALEALAVIAYKQPVTAPEVNEIRGVDSSGVFGSLLARKLIATAGRKQVIGRPILYKTTKEFLLRFGLKDVSELPSMEEFEKMAQLEFDEAEMAGGGETAPAENEDLLPEVDEDLDAPAEEAVASAEQEIEQNVKQSLETAVTADSEVSPADAKPEVTEQPAGTPADEAASTPAEAAPAAPYPLEQAETENVSHE
ncbi:MAG TPA: SMC-Scp complex subunit ScpB [Terracidiphilus sp.]|nr:SMC-Scp complex subunit ScpB [Terracidiphilus sp.]